MGYVPGFDHANQGSPFVGISSLFFERLIGMNLRIRFSPSTRSGSIRHFVVVTLGEYRNDIKTHYSLFLRCWKLNSYRPTLSLHFLIGKLAGEVIAHVVEKFGRG